MCRRLLAFVATLCLCLSTFSVAYADGNSSIGDNWSSGAQVFWYPFDLGGSSKEYCMVSPCSNQFMAALCAIGQLDKYPQLTNPQLALLSNDDTGGAFYDLAERFGSVAEYGYPSWIGGYYLWSISAWADFHTSAKFFGEDHVWYASGLNETMVTNATTDFFKVLNGEVTGDTGDYIQFAVDHVGSDVRSEFQGVTSLRMPKSMCNLLDLNPNVAAVRLTSFRQYSNGLWDFGMVWYVGVGSTLVSTDNGYVMQTPSDGKYGSVALSISNCNVSVDNGAFSILSSTSYISLSANSSGPRDFSITKTSSNMLCIYGGAVSGGGGGDNHWPEPTPPQPQPEPDPPEVPQPPELPTPWNPTIPEPDPPDPINPYTPIVEPEPTGTTPTDYTPWLRAILAALNRIIGDLSTHCQHIQDAIRNASSYLVDAIGDYAEYLAGKLHYELTTIMADLESYLADLAQWLADELDFDRDAQVYDDARLMRVLSEINKVLGDIYARLGDLDSAVSDLSAQLGDIYIRLGQILGKIGSGGGGRPAPTTEPEVDEGFDFWQWLLDLISSKLDSIIEDFVGDIGGFLSELVTKFPFSIPWDIAAYLTLLDAQRVTPVISFVIPAIGGWWGEVPITVDLQPYDNAMAAVRSMMLILWGFCLIMRTDWLGGVFDGATKAVSSFFDRLTGHGGGD